MATKAIKFSNNTTTYLPVTDATLVQMKVGNETKSIQEVILEDEEVTAAGYNELNNRVTALEGADMSAYITQTELSSNSYVTQTALSSNSYVTQTSLSNNSYVTQANLATKGYITSYLAFAKVTSGANSTSYAAITPNTNSPVADAKFDELTINGGNYWIKTAGDATNDKITIGHAMASNTPTSDSMNVNLGGSFKTYSYSFDAAGHRTGSLITTVTIIEPNTRTVIGKDGLTPMKYVEIKSNAPDLNSTWLATIGNGSTSYYMTTCTNASAASITYFAYTKV